MPVFPCFRMIKAGFKRPLLNEDMWNLRPKYQTKNVVPKLLHLWTEKMQKRKPFVHLKLIIKHKLQLIFLYKYDFINMIIC